jgi:hypothetical protein
MRDELQFFKHIAVGFRARVQHRQQVGSQRETAPLRGVPNVIVARDDGTDTAESSTTNSNAPR